MIIVYLLLTVAWRLSVIFAWKAGYYQAKKNLETEEQLMARERARVRDKELQLQAELDKIVNIWPDNRCAILRISVALSRQEIASISDRERIIESTLRTLRRQLRDHYFNSTISVDSNS